MATTVLQTRVDENVKKEAEALFAALGLDITIAIRLFLKQGHKPAEDSLRDSVAPARVFRGHPCSD